MHIQENLALYKKVHNNRHKLYHLFLNKGLPRHVQCAVCSHPLVPASVYTQTQVAGASQIRGTCPCAHGWNVECLLRASQTKVLPTHFFVRPDVLGIAKPGLASLVPQLSHVSWGTRLGLAGGCWWWQVGAGWGEKGGKQEGSLNKTPKNKLI